MMDLLIVLIQALFATGACWLLYVLWVRFASEEVGVLIVAIGFVGRAFLSSALFLISWFHLPIGRSLHLSNGLWFFGSDGRGYYKVADQWIAQGPGAVLLGDQLNPSYVYVQGLAISRLLFGAPISASLLINLAAFIGSAILVARWGRRTGRERFATLSLIGLSLTPSYVLWATQPLKDSLFIFCVVAFFYGFARWLEVGGTTQMREVVGCALILAVAIYLIGGMRWYYGAMLWMIFLPTAGWSGLTSIPRRPRLMVSSIIAFFAMGLSLVLNHYAPFRSAVAAMFRIPVWMFTTLRESKVLFETDFRGATIVEAGAVIEGIPYADIVARGVLIFVPRFIAAPLGLAKVGGGKGLWAFAEIDTLFIVGFGAAVVLMMWKSRPLESIRNPLLIFLVVLFVSSLPMLYAVNNFGTLFRFREMLFLPIVLLPLALPDTTVERDSG